MKCFRIAVLPCLLLAMLSTLFLRAGTVEATALAGCGGWRIQASPNVPDSDILEGVSAAFLNDAWAVGNYINNGGNNQTLIEHWDGSAWSVVPSPNVGTNDNLLTGVAQDAGTHQAWAVGTSFNFAGDTTLIEYWDGTKWSVVKSPNVPGVSNGLSAISFLSASDIWAVGNSFSSQMHRDSTLIERWDGRQWSIVASANVKGASNLLFGVAAVSAKDIWTVGYFTKKPSINKTLVEHWDGDTWRIVASPNVKSSITNTLNSVTVVSAKDVWTVGSIYNNGDRGLIEHWDGAQWRIVASPGLQGKANALLGVAAVDAKTVWAVGEFYDAKSNLNLTLIERWNGKSWGPVASPNIPGFDDVLNAVAVIPEGDALTVGLALNPNTDLSDTLIEFYCA